MGAPEATGGDTAALGHGGIWGAGGGPAGRETLDEMPPALLVVFGASRPYNQRPATQRIA